LERKRGDSLFASFSETKTKNKTLYRKGRKKQNDAVEVLLLLTTKVDHLH